jgi:hypothetical protein
MKEIAYSRRTCGDYRRALIKAVVISKSDNSETVRRLLNSKGAVKERTRGKLKGAISPALMLRDRSKPKRASPTACESKIMKAFETDPSGVSNAAKFGAGSKERTDGSDRR